MCFSLASRQIIFGGTLYRNGVGMCLAIFDKHLQSQTETILKKHASIEFICANQVGKPAFLDLISIEVVASTCKSAYIAWLNNLCCSSDLATGCARGSGFFGHILHPNRWSHPNSFLREHILQ